MQAGWTDVLHDIISKETNIPCIYQFKRSNIVQEEFVAVAECAECYGSIAVTSSDSMKSLVVEIVYGEGEHTYAKRRRMTSVRAKSLVPLLKADTVYNVHSDLINEFEPDCDFLPRNYVTPKALANIKQRYINNTNNSLKALRQLKYNEYCNVIREIGCDPFFIIFWTEAKKFVYSQIVKRKEKVSISIDATGGLVSNAGLCIDLEKRVDLPHIFLYLICLKKPDGKSIPIAQFLGAQQDIRKIGDFF